jgi:PPM family protein phosphatase
MEWNVVGNTDVGKKRTHNEDTFAIEPDLGLLMVCDGMGGHAAGEIASQLAVNTVKAHLAQYRSILDQFDGTDDAGNAVLRLIEEAVQEASRVVHALANSDRGKAGMGTTLTMIVLQKNVAFMGHVGDTRLYVRRGSRTDQFSEDHTYVAEAVKRGISTMEDAKKGPYANVITRAVGVHAQVRVDTLRFDVLSGDTLMLCSDGLSRYLESLEEVAGLLSMDSIESLPARAIELANGLGGVDNITALPSMVAKATRRARAPPR